MLYFPASTENFSPPALASLYFAERYLFTVYPFLIGKRPVSLIEYAFNLFPDKPVMIDSGVYSLMHKNELVSTRDLIKYTHKYLEILQRVNFQGQFVEVDSQYIEEEPGAYKTLRKLYDAYGMSNRVIYVWHFTDGFDELWDMMSKYKRVALSPKEIHLHLKKKGKQKQYKDKVLNLFRHIQKRVQQHHIHLLGTMLDWIAYLPHNWTCDSSSWTSGLTWGFYFLESPFGFDFRDNEVNASPAIVRRVDEAMPELMRIYDDAPRFSKRQKLRVDSVRKMSISMLSINEWWEAETLRRFGEYPKPNDPLDFEGEK